MHYIDNHSTVPTDDHEVFVGDSFIDAEASQMPIISLLSSSFVSEWSLKRDEVNLHIDSKAWKDSPIISLEDYTQAHQWLLKKKEVIQLNGFFYTPSNNESKLSKSQVKQFIKETTEMEFTCFERFASTIKSIWSININSEDHTKSYCSCPFYAKNYKCKHVIGLTNHLGSSGFLIPATAKQIPLGEKRKR